MPLGPRLAACLVASLWVMALGACSAGPSPWLSVGAGLPRCQLPAPRSSDDACSVAADCGVSEPCHAPACVGKARSHPARAGILCTQNLVCDSADANRCDCFEGRCALLPPS